MSFWRRSLPANIVCTQCERENRKSDAREEESARPKYGFHFNAKRGLGEV